MYQHSYLAVVLQRLHKGYWHPVVSPGVEAEHTARRSFPDEGGCCVPELLLGGGQRQRLVVLRGLAVQIRLIRNGLFARIGSGSGEQMDFGKGIQLSQ